MFKSILKYLVIFLVGVLIALLVAPFVFKDRIYQELKTKINQQLNAEVDFKEVDVSFIKSFPEISVSLSDIHIVGVDTFRNIDLIKGKKLNLDFSLLPFFDKSKPMALKYIGLEDGLINILVLNDSLANYNITKPTNDTSSFTLALDHYKLKNCRLTYNDVTLPFKMIAKGTNHAGSGNLSSNVYDLLTSTQIDSLTAVYDAVTYLSNIKASLDAKVNIDFTKMKFTLLDNALSLNKLKMTGDGYVQLNKDESMTVDATLKSAQQSFGNFLSALPNLSAYNTAKANGNVAINASVKGKYNGIKNIFPSYDVKLDIANGSAQYEGLPQPLENVNGKVHIVSTRPDMKDLKVAVNNFNAEVGNEKLKGNFNITESMSDPRYVGDLIADIHLENWTKAIPMSDAENISGAVVSNFIFDARQSDIDKNNYAAMQFDGKFDASNINIKFKGKQPIFIPNAILNASPQKIDVKTGQIKFGKSDLVVLGELENPLAYFSEIKNIKGRLDIKSEVLDLNEWVTQTKTTESASGAVSGDLSVYKYNEIDMAMDIKQIYYGKHDVKDVVAKGKFGMENIDLKTFTANVDGSKLNLNGKLANVYSYMMGKETLAGDLEFYSPSLDANKYMVQSEETNATADSVLFKVPKHVDVKLRAKIDALQYTNLDLKNCVGTVVIKDQSMLIQDMNVNALGGRMGFDGLYATKALKPDFNFKLDLAKIDFAKAYGQFVTMKYLAPIANYIDGVFNTTLVMEGKLGKGMIPDITNITTSGLIETLNGIVKGFKPLQAAGEKLGVKELADLELKDTKNWFDVKQGVVELKEFSKNIKGIDIKGAGKHKIKGDMDYAFFLRIPRALLKKNNVVATAEKGWGWLEKEAGRIGVNIAQGEYIDLRMTMKGTLSKPAITIVPIGTSGKTLEQEIKDETKKQIEKAKDSVQKVIVKKTESIKDTLRAKAEQKVDEIKAKAEEKANDIVNDAKEKAKKEVEAKIDSMLGKTVSDTLKKKAGQIIKDKTGKEVDDLKNKVKDWNPFKKKKDGQIP